MAIRLRNVNGTLVALCAARCKPKDGDVYLDDNQHYALANKFGLDWGRNHDDVPYHNSDHIDLIASQEDNLEEWNKIYG